MRRYLLLISSLAFLASCGKESEKSTYATQETRIESFISSQMKSVEDARLVTNNGSSRLVVVEGSGEELKSNGVVSFYYAGYTLTGTSLSSSNLFATNKEDIANSAKWNLSDENALDIITLDLSEAELVEGLKNGIEGVKGGEECYILFSGEHGFGKRQLGTISANSALAYHIWVESISND